MAGKSKHPRAAESYTDDTDIPRRLGSVTALPAMKYEDIVDLFERQWRTLAMQHVNQEPLELIP